MAFPQLGRLEILKATDVWRFEAQTFTPWLAENLELLSEELQIGDLELRGTEVAAGDFRIDLLAEDGEGNPVIVENQFGSTDHRHLGQLITYVASQPGPATVVWIAERVREEHRAAIDWLNASTIERLNFFALELEALKIGDSLPAPYLNIVAKPNNWTRAVSAAARQAASGMLAERHHSRAAYWRGFDAYLRAAGARFRVRPDNIAHWSSFAIGRAGLVLSATITPKRQRIGVELYVRNDPQKLVFEQLERRRAEVEAAIGFPLEWERLPNRAASRVALYLTGVDAFDEAQQPRLHAWMLDMLGRFRATFAPIVRELVLPDDTAGPDDMPAADPA
ncbi:DUF4268 domain-containing protein [Ancylobacter sp. Lp-2]|uniref:DUF4268 domain-containing protein n=1 Tax=Ancylobacter sp. Lp-2 TaxID=2881339 RepID=UPI001E60DFF4|nr:DUF4268 domain-containing protein [Ancylobacter sp. Lp-2]